ncbi:MAG: RNase adapter RapZ, partial [Pseudomonadota bacterium]
PAVMLPTVVPEVVNSLDGAVVTDIAVGVDARNRTADLESLPEFVESLRAGGDSCDIVFLQTDDDVLLRRYRETRRRHPLARDGVSLRDAISTERDLLGPLLNAADLIIDTSATGIYELRDIIATRVAERKPRALSILIESFGFKHGIPSDSDFVFDLRCLPNPYWEPTLRPLTGHDAAVAEFLDAQPAVRQMYDDIRGFLEHWIPHYVSFHRSYLTVALGCTGGQHRSVYMVEKLAAALAAEHAHVKTRHNELP